MGHQNVADGLASLLAPGRLSELIGEIYDCALDPVRWEPTLAEIARVLDCEKAILSLNDLRNDRALISKSVGWESHWLQERAKHIPEIHGKLAEWLAHGPDPDMPFVASREIPVGELASSPYVQSCLKPQGIVDIAHFFLITTPTHFSELVLGRQQQQGVITEREIGLGTLLLPHLRRAVTINDLMDVKTLERQALGATLDSFAVGVVIVGDQGRILHANEAARGMLDARSPIVSSGGCLAALNADITRELLKAVALAQSDEAAIGAAGIGVPLLQADMTVATAHVLPLARGDVRTRMVPQATAAVFIVPAGTPFPADLATVARIFGLTPAETRQLAQLMAGATLAEAAAALGVSQATARTHREHIFAKAGVSRHGELVALVRRLVPPVHRRS
ncbi:helix-turn-helix transcriptional regulator [Inquilinus limosus]|uniref:helix-turn-helix transcriptional regulator n=1 Tax=Inquilinus limosus TaxID=171674 RepID=UPI003F1413C8